MLDFDDATAAKLWRLLASERPESEADLLLLLLLLLIIIIIIITIITIITIIIIIRCRVRHPGGDLPADRRVARARRLPAVGLLLSSLLL